ncbi:MAG TPA: hypothetical protein VIG52_13410 [Methyloceanibacter sp.]
MSDIVVPRFKWCWEEKLKPHAYPFIGLRIEITEGVVIDAIKVALIENIDKTGSLTAARQKLGIAHRNAWLHIQAANKLFKQKIVVSTVGGKNGGAPT